VWWQVALPLGSLVIALPASVTAYLAFRRSSSAEASRVGLEYLRESLRFQQETIVRQEHEIGVVRGELNGCREERQIIAREIADLRKAIS
jgi:hypothetical protein